MGIAKSTLPDVCKTPSPGGPVPIPYPVIVSLSSDLKKGTKTVKVDRGKMAAIKGSEFSRCSGDEAGTVGGIKSSKNMKEATWILYSFDVKIDGKNACRLSDKMMMNHGNTVCLAGCGNPDVYKDICDELGKKNDKEINNLPKHMKQRKNKKTGEISSKSTTVATSLFEGTGGQLGFSSPASSAISRSIRGKKYRHLTRGISKGTPSGITTCAGDPFVYEESFCAKEGHAEAKIIENIFTWHAAPGVRPTGTLYLQIKNTNPEKNPWPPCDDCQRMIDEINGDCDDFKIVICD